MSKLNRDPKIVRLAGELGLSKRGNCLKRITEFALSKVEDIIDDSPIPIGNLEDLRLMIANKVSMKLELIETDEDIERIATKYSDFHPALHQRLRLEFIESSTEGITLERERWQPPQHRYLAIIDARGGRNSRAYFTSWHEISHLLVHPPQEEFPGFRRTPTEQELDKDPIESLVDYISGHVAFYEPFFEPVLVKQIEKHDGLTFEAIEESKDKAAPEASLFATAIQSINYYSKPALLLRVAPSLKKQQQRVLNSEQQRFNFAEPDFSPKIRAVTVIRNEKAREQKTFEIRPNMRVPPQSILYEAAESLVDMKGQAKEDQKWWETSSRGYLASLPIDVETIKRGPYTYGIITLRN